MFVYLSKKIAIPSGSQLNCLSWNKTDGWVVCGGDMGILKVIKLQTNQSSANLGLAAPSNLSMNESLTEHSTAVTVVTWNERFRRLTTCDASGRIVVWMSNNGSWIQEMVHTRSKSPTKSVQWTYDGQKICIAYEDGEIIVGTVSGDRLWGKSLRQQVVDTAWSPDGKFILFGFKNGNVHAYDASGNFFANVPIFCAKEGEAEVSNVEWHDCQGFINPKKPSLAICYSNGKCQIMRSEHDTEPHLIDSELDVSCISWNPFGTVLAIAGKNKFAQDVSDNFVQFYSHKGEHLTSMKVGRSEITGVSWEGTGLRLALAINSAIYFANVRPDYKWAYLPKTLIYSYEKPERMNDVVTFWNFKTGEKHSNTLNNVVHVLAKDEYSALISKSPKHPRSNTIYLCNSIGNPLETRSFDIDPCFGAMSSRFVAIGSESEIFIWNFNTENSSKDFVDMNLNLALKRKSGEVTQFNIDYPDEDFSKARKYKVSDAISAIAVSNRMLLVGKTSGQFLKFSLPDLNLESKFVIPQRPLNIEINSDSTRIAIIDVNSIFSAYRLVAPEGEKSSLEAKKIELEKKDVWNVKWSEDNPELFALIEKTRMYVVRGSAMEEPVVSCAYICEFDQLKIKAAQLDAIFEDPESPSAELVMDFETRSLRDTRRFLESTSIESAYQFIKEKPHPRLWKLLAAKALETLKLEYAELAYLNCFDYGGVQFVKRLNQIEGETKQQAEVAAHFKRFDEAENIYLELDRSDLAIELRKKTGSWFRVLNLIQERGSDDALLIQVLNNIGQYYADRQMWSRAAPYFEKSGNFEKLIDCYYSLEDFNKLEYLIEVLQDNSPLLSEIGELFTSVGMGKPAVDAFLKEGQLRKAVDCCVELNQWDKAVELAKKHKMKDIAQLLSKYANHLVEKNKNPQAIELYQKANKHTDAAKLLSKIADQVGQDGQDPMRAKKLYVMAAFEVEKLRRKILSDSDGEGNSRAAKTLDSLLQHDRSTGQEKKLDNAWKGAEAYHFYMLAHRRLYEGKIKAALTLSLRLTEYNDILPEKNIHCLIAICSFHARQFGTCSRSFIKLESLDTNDKESFSDLAMDIFTRHPPRDPANNIIDCPNCDNQVYEWNSKCNQCHAIFHPCICTGVNVEDNYWVCAVCKHRAIEHEIFKFDFCPLCHTKVKI